MNNKLYIYMIILCLIAGSFLLGIGMYGATKVFKPLTLNLLAAGIIIFGTLWATLGKYLQDSSSSEKSTRTLDAAQGAFGNTSILKAQNDKLVKKADDQAQTIDQLRAENSDLHAKLANVSNNIFNQVTGGKNVPVVTFLSFQNQLEVIVNNTDKLIPLRNVQVHLTITYLDQFNDLGNGVLAAPHDDDNSKDLVLDFKDLSPESLYNTQIVKYAKSNHKSIFYIFDVRWLNGHYHGGFTARFLTNEIKIEGAEFSSYTKGIDLKGKCAVLGTLIPPPIVSTDDKKSH